MRKALSLLGALALLLIVGGGIGLFKMVRNTAALEAESRAYVEDAVVNIAAQWSKDELLKRATPHLRSIAPPEDLRSLFEAAAAGLGPFVSYVGSKGGTMVSVMTGSGTNISAKYVARATFQKGDADFQITLLKVDGTWMIEGFYIGSLAMMRNLSGRQT